MNMPRYDVHLYREMRLLLEGIEAPSHEEAAALARRRSGEDADFIDDCHGEDFAALVDVAGDEQYQQSRMIDFEGEAAVPGHAEDAPGASRNTTPHS
jgi:hypothetical protein